MCRWKSTHSQDVRIWARDTHFWLRRLLRPGRPPPNGLLSAKSMCFWLSTRTMNDGTFTICFPTLQRHRAIRDHAHACAG